MTPTQVGLLQASNAMAQLVAVPVIAEFWMAYWVEIYP